MHLRGWDAPALRINASTSSLFSRVPPARLTGVPETPAAQEADRGSGPVALGRCCLGRFLQDAMCAGRSPLRVSRRQYGHGMMRLACLVVGNQHTDMKMRLSGCKHLKRDGGRRVHLCVSVRVRVCVCLCVCVCVYVCVCVCVLLLARLQVEGQRRLEEPLPTHRTRYCPGRRHFVRRRAQVTAEMKFAKKRKKDWEGALFRKP